MGQIIIKRHQFVFVIILYFHFFRLFVYAQQQVINKILYFLINCFFFQGLIALAYSLKSSAKADVKFHDKARLYARRALLWNLISVILVVFSFIMVLNFVF
jgi:hypothetical protein